MKKIFIILLALCSISISAQNATKVIYSNGLTHCFVTAVQVKDTLVMFDISETSQHKIWTLTGEMETQQLGLLDKSTAIKLFETALDMFEKKEKGDTRDINKYISLAFVKIYGIKCVKIHNNIVGTDFNINKSTAQGALDAIRNLNGF